MYTHGTHIIFAGTVRELVHKKCVVMKAIKESSSIPAAYCSGGKQYVFVLARTA